MKHVTYSIHTVLTLVKIKHRAPETQLNPCLIFLSMLEQMQVELTDEHIHAHGRAGGSYEFCTKHDMTLRYEVSKSDQLPVTTIKNVKKNHQHAKSSKIIIFRAGSGTTIITHAKSWSHQVTLHSMRVGKRTMKHFRGGSILWGHSG